MSEGKERCQHVAIIMDGNGRWAERNRLARALGHRAGVKAVKRSVECAIKNGIKVLTVYAFSTENWKRPQEEVSYLMDLFYQTLEGQLKALHRAGVRLSFIGDLSPLSVKLQEKLFAAVELTQDNDVLDFVVAINYGGRQEIVNACKNLAEEVIAGDLEIDEITESRFEKALTMSDLPPVDLLIRTSGEQRISNFLIWQLAYAELYFIDCHWPDFGEKEFEAALAEFYRRERRFGGR
ncbi:ditrans,polycis-undecaprenyl-diphosphate synthase ((2E,6E)-farnesyl-diphosphate specific) [Ignatzschineria indica]|nr:polyprenyl diphosphate synthase [Ignatzschineria indica]GGZ79285.1 ditrans,polycis-undecaprenyl-diphosphate synthase ((2E,6E)-farnesyl-diphosphate specific) [Ignatzschineria indica]